jgi:hypothetical protein
MNIGFSNFHDKALAQVTIGYDWAQSLNYALVSVNKRMLSDWFFAALQIIRKCVC